MNANWYGLAGKRFSELFGRVSESEVVSGIPGAETGSLRRALLAH